MIKLANFLKGKDSERQGWLESFLNETTLQGQDDRKASFILLRALADSICSSDPEVQRAFERAFPVDLRPIATSPLEDTIKQYLGLQPLLGGKPVRGANVDVAVSACGAEEIPRLFTSLEDLLLMLARSGVGELRRRWIVEPRNQLKPTEIHIMKLFAYRLLGNPNIWGRGNTSFTQLIMKAFGLKSHRPIGYHLKPPHFTMTPVHAMTSPTTRRITKNAQSENATMGQEIQRPGLLSSAKKITAKISSALSNLRRTTEKMHSDNNNDLQSERSESNPDRSSTNESDTNKFVTRQLNFSILGSSANNSMQASVQPDEEEAHQSTNADDSLPLLDVEPQRSRLTFDSDAHVFPQHIQDADEEDFYPSNSNGDDFQQLLDNEGPQGSATEMDMSFTLAMQSPMGREQTDYNSFDKESSTNVQQQHRPVTRNFSQATTKRAAHDFLPPAADEELIDDDSDEWREDEDDLRGQPRKRHNSNPTPAKDSRRSKNGPKRKLPQDNIPTSLQSETRHMNRVEAQHFTFDSAETDSADATARASRKLMDIVAHLVIHGSSRVQQVCKAMLVGSCNAATSNTILQHHGWAAKRKAQVIQQKVQVNNRIRRQQEKENKEVREEDLVPEVCKMKFAAPLSDSRTRKNHLQNLQKLKRGEDLPPRTARTTRITWEQTDKLAEYIGRHCQQRPGKLRRARIDGQKLPLLTCYIRYGSIIEHHRQYKAFVGSENAIGYENFQKCMDAVTKKGISNGGLSYFWVDFIDNIKLAKDVATRLEEIIKKSAQMTKEEKDELTEWTVRIKQVFNFTSLYLRHRHYQTLQKSCQDGYCCVQYALGAECDHQHTFSKNHGLCLCLTAHVFIGKAAVVVKQKLKEVKSRSRSVDESSAVRSAATASDPTQEAANSPEAPSAAMEVDATFEQNQTRVGSLEEPLRISAASDQMGNSTHEQPESLLSPPAIRHTHTPNIIRKPTRSPAAHDEEENVGFESSVDVQGDFNQRHNHSPNTTHEPTRSAAHDEEGNQTDRPLNPLFLELDSMVKLSNVLQHDLRHYLKHVTRSWWQKKAEEEIRRKMINNPNIKMMKPDHKNKTLAQCLFEAMSEYFGKHGISCLGTYVMWYGKNEHGIEGFFSWYIDIIIENTTSQEARDMMPCFETIVEELLNPNFETIAGNTNIIYLGSDNALTSVELSLFVSMMNKKYSEKGIQVRNWINSEAQTNKGSVDTHFHFMNIQLAKAVANSGSKLACPHTMCDCCVYGGGIRATTTILLKERYEAQQVFDCCKDALSKADRSGITKIHDQYFHESGEVRWRPFSNNPNDEKEIPADRAKKALSNWQN